MQNLGASMSEHPTVDMFAASSVLQRSATAAISRWPQDHPKFLARTGAFSYDWKNDEALQGKQLYCHPPPALTARVLQKIEDDDVEVFLTVPLMEKKPAWWQSLVQMATAYTLIPWHPRLHVHPKGPEHSDDVDKGWALITARLSPIAWKSATMTQEQQTTPWQPTPIAPVNTNLALGQSTPPTTTTVRNEGCLSTIEAWSY